MRGVARRTRVRSKRQSGERTDGWWWRGLNEQAGAKSVYMSYRSHMRFALLTVRTYVNTAGGVADRVSGSGSMRAQLITYGSFICESARACEVMLRPTAPQLSHCHVRSCGAMSCHATSRVVM